MAIGIVYCIKQGERNLYVGSSCEFDKRSKHHIWMLRNGQHTNKHLQKLFDMGELTKLTFSVLEECGQDELISREKHWIIELQPECNMLYATDENASWTHDEDTRKIMSEKQRGKKHNMSPEGRAVCAENGRKSKGRKWNHKPEAVEKIRAAKQKDCPVSREELKAALEEYHGFSNVALKHPILSVYAKKTIQRWCEDYGLPYSAVDYGKASYERPPKEVLINALKGRGYWSASEDFDTSPNVVKRWCCEYGLPYKKSDWV